MVWAIFIILTIKMMYLMQTGTITSNEKKVILLNIPIINSAKTISVKADIFLISSFIIVLN